MSDDKKPNVLDPNCSARDALELIASKWTILILTALSEDSVRNGELLCRIGNVSQKMLTQTLRNLECNGLVTRHDFRTVPPRVEYRLTTLGKSLSRVLKGLDRWAVQNFPRLDAARAQYLAKHNKVR